MFRSVRGHTIYAPSLGPHSVVLDLGANRGEFSRQMMSHFGGTYYLAEANPALSAELRKDERFNLWPCAVAESEGLVSFNVAKNDEGSSLLTLPAQSAYACVLLETIAVQARTLASLISEIRLSRIDLVKMDIEGAEVAVLETLPKSILNIVGQITVEFHSDPIFGFDLRSRAEGVIRQIRHQGFVCLDFSRGARTDVLFVNRAVHRISWLQGLRWEFRACPPKWQLRLWQLLPALARKQIGSLLNWILRQHNGRAS